MKYRPNPEWADIVLRQIKGLIASELGDEWVPIVTPGTIEHWRELGDCGSYGCVYATGVPNVVMKMTTDLSEAAFVSLAMAQGFPWHPGMARYYHALESPVKAYHYQQDRVFCLWREEADKFGEAEPPDALEIFQDHANMANNIMRGWPDMAVQDMWRCVEGGPPERPEFGAPVPPPASRMAEVHSYLAVCEEQVAVLKRTAIWKPVAAAMEYYMNLGLLLGDVHEYNVGTVTRNGKESLAITDPGIMIPLRAEFRRAEIPMMTGGTYDVPRMLANRGRR